MTLLRATVRQSALLHNIQMICRRSLASPVWAVLKADAYGHRASLLVPMLSGQVDGMACARLDEAIELDALSRHCQWRTHILILGGVYRPDELEVAANHDFQVVCHCLEQMDLIKTFARNNPSRHIKVWIKFNSGMNRLGFEPEGLINIVIDLQPWAQVVGVMAHLGTADEPLRDITLEQIERCNQYFAELRQRFPGIQTSLSNSAHLMISQKKSYVFRGLDHDWVRPGISMYGATPSVDMAAADLGLRSVLKLEAVVVDVREVQPGATVGYGATWIAQKPTKIFIIACGYGDGLPRSSRCSVFFGDLELKQAGRVSMDLSAYACDRDNQSAIHPVVGDYVEVWGDRQSVDTVAKASGTIGYELLTGLRSRVEFIAC